MDPFVRDLLEADFSVDPNEYLSTKYADPLDAQNGSDIVNPADAYKELTEGKVITDSPWGGNAAVEEILADASGKFQSLNNRLRN